MTDRELDALVAEKVMGYSEKITVYAWYDRKAKKYPRVAFKVSSDKDDSIGAYSAHMDESGKKIFCGRPHNLFFPKPYSTDIAAAWMVVEKMAALGYRLFELCSQQTEDMPLEWVARFKISDCRWASSWNRSEAVPRTICLAALAAKGVRVEADR